LDLGTTRTRESAVEAAAAEAVAKATEKAAAEEVEAAVKAAAEEVEAAVEAAADEVAVVVAAAVEAEVVEGCKDLQRFAFVWSKLRDCCLDQPIRK